MPRVGFEPRTPVFERAKTIHVIDLAATVLGTGTNLPYVYFSLPVRITNPAHHFIFDFLILVMPSEEYTL
jgi:hypothetical protein